MIPSNKEYFRKGVDLGCSAQMTHSGFVEPGVNASRILDYFVQDLFFGS
jgi:hypothetical protein